MIDRILFLSFSKLIIPLRQGLITNQDLACGLFYFGCVREHVMGSLPSKEDIESNSGYIGIQAFTMHEWFFWDKSQPYKQTYQFAKTLQNAILKAESEGRIAWRKKNDTDEWQQLSSLLNNFGVNIDIDSLSHINYCYPAAVELISPHMKIIA